MYGIICGSAKKAGFICPKLKHCEWFAMWMTGPRLIGSACGLPLKASDAKTDASWEILK